jgi:hypothetical protein
MIDSKVWPLNQTFNALIELDVIERRDKLFLNERPPALCVVAIDFSGRQQNFLRARVLQQSLNLIIQGLLGWTCAPTPGGD